MKKNEQEMLELFQVEELEKRYEMGWIKSGSATTKFSYDDSGFGGEVGATLNF